MAGCLSDDAILEFVEGRDAGDAHAMAELHIDACETCRSVVAQAAKYVLRLTGAGPGTVMDRYVVGEVLGAGGMGIVHKAYDKHLRRTIAVKFLRGASRNASDRLLREARAMAQLGHPNVVSVYDVGAHEGNAFVAMEWVGGQTLRAWLRAGERSREDILEGFVGAGRGLAAAHAAGIVHGDFKPENVLIGQDGRARVTDFGLAREVLAAPSEWLDAEHSDSCVVTFPEFSTFSVRSGTSTVRLAGTPAYMAPEQFNGQAADAQSDQFAFCVALYEALLGERPFRGTTLLELSAAISLGEVHPPPEKVASIPKHIMGIVLRGMRVRREERFASMDHLLVALTSAGHRPRRTRAPVRAVLGGSILILAGVAAWPLMRRSAPSTVPSAQAVIRGPVVPSAQVSAEPPPMAVTPPVPAETEIRAPSSPPNRKRTQLRVTKPHPVAASIDDLRPPSFAKERP